MKSYRNKQECKHIAAEYQQGIEKTRVCIKRPKLDTFVKSLAFSKLSFKRHRLDLCLIKAVGFDWDQN